MSGIFVGLNSHIMEGFDSVLTSVAADTGVDGTPVLRRGALAVHHVARLPDDGRQACPPLRGDRVGREPDAHHHDFRHQRRRLSRSGFGCHHRPAGRIQRRRVDLGAAGYGLGKGSSTWGEALLL